MWRWISRPTGCDVHPSRCHDPIRPTKTEAQERMSSVVRWLQGHGHWSIASAHRLIYHQQSIENMTPPWAPGIRIFPCVLLLGLESVSRPNLEGDPSPRTCHHAAHVITPFYVFLLPSQPFVYTKKNARLWFPPRSIEPDLVRCSSIWTGQVRNNVSQQTTSSSGRIHQRPFLLTSRKRNREH